MIPAAGLNESYRALAAVDDLVRNIYAVTGFGGWSVDFPTHTIADAHIAAEFVFVLSEEVVLLGALALSPEADRFFAGLEGKKCIAPEVADEAMSKLGGNAE